MKMHAANERTFLAWMRTALALVSLGYALGRFAHFVEQGSSDAQALHVHIGSVSITALGIVSLLLATVRYARTRRNIERGGDLSVGASAVYAVSGTLVAIAVFLLVLLLQQGG